MGDDSLWAECRELRILLERYLKLLPQRDFIAPTTTDLVKQQSENRLKSSDELMVFDEMILRTNQNAQERGDEPNQILLVTISHMLYPITPKTLYQVFSPHGLVEEIVPLQQSVGFQVQFREIQNAMSARIALQGRNIYDGCCRMDIQFAKDAGSTTSSSMKQGFDGLSITPEQDLAKIQSKFQQPQTLTIVATGSDDSIVSVVDHRLKRCENSNEEFPTTLHSPSSLTPLLMVEIPTDVGSEDPNEKGMDLHAVFRKVRLNSLMEDEKVGHRFLKMDEGHQMCQFNQLKSTIKRIDERGGMDVESKEVNQLVDGITSMDIRNHRISLLPPGEGGAGMSIIHQDKSLLIISVFDLVESDDPYGFRLLLMEDELRIVDKNLLRPVNEVMDVKDPYRFRLLVMGNHLSDLKFEDPSLPFFNEYTLNEAPELVVVVTLLKELDASKKLSTLVEGESLMNDGTSIVVGTFFTGGSACRKSLISFT